MSADDRKLIAKLKRRITLARRFPTNTDPCSRHLEALGEALAAGRSPTPADQLASAVAVLFCVDALYRARNEVERLKKRKPRSIKT